MFTKLAAIAILGIFILPGAALAQQKEKKEEKKYGACTITVYGITPTCSWQTQNGCNETAKKVGGTSSWSEGKTCPK